MKRLSVILLLVCTMLLAVACGADGNTNTPGGDTNNGVNQGTQTVQEVVMSELPESVTAELGERYTIPEVTAKQGDVSLTVTVVVKDSQGEEVELTARGTKFSATDLGGYTMTFTATGEGGKSATKTVTVTVTDSDGPEIILPAAAYNMTAKLNSTVSIPVPTYRDMSGEIKSTGYSVKFGENEVSVQKGENEEPDTFAVTAYGKYTITYTATDKYDNVTTEVIEVNCVRSILLCGFEVFNTDVYGASEFDSQCVTEHAVDGKAFKMNAEQINVNPTDPENPRYEYTFQQIAVFPEYYDMSGFDSYQITVYASRDLNSGNEGLYLLNHQYFLDAGENVINISKSDFNAEYAGGKIPSVQRPEYGSLKFLYFQFKANSAATIWVDNLIGIFDNYDADTAEPIIDTGTVALRGAHLSYVEGSVIPVPEASAYDNSMETIEVNCVVKTKDGTDITDAAKTGNYKAVLSEAPYTVEYTAADSAGNNATKSIIIDVQPKPVIPDIAASEYFPAAGRHYDLLQDFEVSGGDYGSEAISWTNATSTPALSEEHAMYGSHSVKVTTSGDDSIVKIALKKNEKNLTDIGWGRYEQIKAYIYVESDTALFAYYYHVPTGGTTYSAGPHVVTISSADILTEIAKADNVYHDGSGFFFRIGGGTVFVDAIIGVYPEGYDPATALPEEIEGYYPASGIYYDVLQNFESDSAVSVLPENTVDVNNTHALTVKETNSNAVHIAWSAGDHNCDVLKVKMQKNGANLELSDWKAYESFRLYLYAENSGTLWFLGKGVPFTAGHNVIEISKTDMVGQIQSNAECYNAAGYFWCQFTGSGEIWLDEFIGIYPEGYDPANPPPAEEDPDMTAAEYFPASGVQYDILNDFEDSGANWCSAAVSKAYSTDHAISGSKSVCLSTTGEWQCCVLTIKKDGAILTDDDWDLYSSFTVYVYSEKSGAKFCFLNRVFDLQKGANKLSITLAEMKEQLANTNVTPYDVEGGFYFQISTGTMYVDAIVGIRA